MKRICAFTLTIIMVFLLAGCGCEHEWVDATCTAPETCLLCGETRGEALGHEWTEATCTERRTCTRCGAGEGVPLGHDYGDWEVTTPAGYSTKGEMSRVCSVCGAVETRELPMLTDIIIGDYESFAFVEEAESEEESADGSEDGTVTENLVPFAGITLTVSEDSTFVLDVNGTIFSGKWIYGDYENDGLRLYVLEESTENMLVFVNTNEERSYDLSLTVSDHTILFNNVLNAAAAETVTEEEAETDETDETAAETDEDGTTEEDETADDEG